MASAFEWAAKNVVRELSRNGELIPVDSLKSSTHFSPYYLVRKKARSSLFWRSKYVWLNLTLKDILDPSSPEPEVTQHGPFHFNDEVDGQVSGSVEVTASVKGKISGQTSVSNKTILEVKTLIVSPNTWDSLQKERKLKTPEPSIIQELRKRGENLYVVTEAVKTQKEAILKRSRKKEGFGKITIPGASCVQGEGQGSLNTMKTVTVPEGSILAFQVAKLIIQDQWNVLLLPDKNQKTFPPKDIKSTMRFTSDISLFNKLHLPPQDYLLSHSCLGSRDHLWRDFKQEVPSDSYRIMIVNTVLGFEKLQAEVENEQRPLTMLDTKLQHFLLQALLGLLQSEQDLLDLEDMP